MGRGRILRTARHRLLATSSRARADVGYLRSKDDSPVAPSVGGRRAEARRSDSCRRKDHLAIGHWWPRTSLERHLEENGEMGLDRSSLLLAALTDHQSC